MAYSLVYVVSLFSFPNWLNLLLKNLRFQGIWNLEDFTVCIMAVLYSLVQCPVLLLSFEMVYPQRYYDVTLNREESQPTTLPALNPEEVLYLCYVASLHILFSLHQ